MRYRAGRILTGVLITAAIAVAVGEWQTARPDHYGWGVHWSRNRLADGWTCRDAAYLDLACGRVILIVSSFYEPPGDVVDPGWAARYAGWRIVLGQNIRPDWVEHFDAASSPARRVFGFYVYDLSGPWPGRAMLAHRAIACPPWFAPALLLTWPAYRAARRLRRAAVERHRFNRGLCVGCGYDLSGTPDRCPECGRVATGRPT